MTAKIVHAFRILNGQETKVNSISKMIDGKMVLVWPLASPFYLDFNTIFGIPTHVSVTCADSILAKLPPFISISHHAMLELMASDELRADILNGVALSSEPSLHPANPDMFSGGTSLIQDTSVVLRELEKSENALPIPSVTDFMAALKHVKRGVLNGVQPVSVEFLPLLSPAEKTGSEDAQATISHALPRVLEIKDLAVSENHPGIVDGEPILATIIDAKNDKVDPFLFHGDVLITDAVKRGGENADPFLFRGMPLVADGLLTESEVISPIPQESVSKIAKSRLMDSTRTLSLLLAVEPYTPVGFYAEQKVAQPMVTGLDLSTVHGQSEGHEKPGFYLLSAYSDIGLYGEEELLNRSVGTASIVTEHKMQAAENIEVKAVQPSNTQVKPTHTAASDGIGKVNFSPILDSVPKLTDAFDGSNNAETAFPFYGAPNLMAGLAAESKATNLPIFRGDALIADTLEVDSKATSPFSQAGTARIIGLSGMQGQQVFLLSLKAIPNYLLGACGENNSTVPVVGKLISSIFPAQQEGGDRANAQTSAVSCIYDLGTCEEVSDANFGVVTNSLEYRLAEPKAVDLCNGFPFAAQPIPTHLSVMRFGCDSLASTFTGCEAETVDGVFIEENMTDPMLVCSDIRYTPVSKTEKSGIFFAPIYGTPRMIEVGNSASGRPNVFIAFQGAPTNMGTMEMEGDNTYSVFQKVNHRQVGTSRFDMKQTVLSSVFAVPYTPVVNFGGVQSTPSVTGRFYPELLPIQSEGHDSPTLYSSMVRCGFDLHEPVFFDSINFGAAASRAEYRLVDPMVQYNMTTVGTEANIIYSLRGKMSLQTDYLPSTAFTALLLDQHPMQAQHTVDTFGAYGVSNIQYQEILRFTNRSEAGGVSVLLPNLIGTYEEREAAPYGGCSVTEPGLRDSLSIPNESVIRSSADARPSIRLPIEVSCGAALMGANRMDYAPNVLEVADLDSAHITTIDLLPVGEIDLWPVSADDEESYFRYQF